MNSAGVFIKIGLFTILCTTNPNLFSNETSQLSQNKVDEVSLTNVKLDSFSQEGNLELELEATSLRQDVSSGESHLTNPRLKLETPSGTLWSINSQIGTISTRGSNPDGISDQRIELSGNVLISRRTDEGLVVEIRGDNFILFPKRQYAETLSSVTVNSGNNLTTAGKLSIDLRLGRVELSSNSGNYVKTKISELKEW